MLVGGGTGVTVGRAVAFGCACEASCSLSFTLDSVSDSEHDTADNKITRIEIAIKLILNELFTNLLSFIGINFFQNGYQCGISEKRHSFFRFLYKLFE